MQSFDINNLYELSEKMDKILQDRCQDDNTENITWIWDCDFICFSYC